jgi:hypothetical protein
MDYVKVLLERGEKKGIQQGIKIGKKYTIYDAYKRNSNLELLSQIFDLSPKQILEIVDELKKLESEKQN